MYAIYIVECTSFKGLRKVLVLNKKIDINNLIKAHAEVYDCEESDVVIHNELEVSDTTILDGYIRKLSAGNPTRFVNVSRDTIANIVQGISQLDKVVQEQELNVVQFDNLSWSFKNGNEEVSKEESTEHLITRYPMYCAATAAAVSSITDEVQGFDIDTVFATVNCSEDQHDIIDSKTILFCRNIPFGMNKCIGIESSDYYNEELFRLCFPEVEVISIPDFPRHKLANKMLTYKLTRLINDQCNPQLSHILSITEKIKDFFGVHKADIREENPDVLAIGPQPMEQIESGTPTCGHIDSDIPSRFLPLTRPNLVLIEENENDNYSKVTPKAKSEGRLEEKKSHYVKRFAAEKCKTLKGCKIKSSELFNDFREFCTKEADMTIIAFDKMYNNTSFTLLMKKFTDYETKRNSDAVYWIDLCIYRPSKDAILSSVIGCGDGTETAATFCHEGDEKPTIDFVKPSSSIPAVTNFMQETQFPDQSLEEELDLFRQKRDLLNPIDLLPNPVFNKPHRKVTDIYDIRGKDKFSVVYP